ncbi:MAG: hypothetical protein C0395_03065 [Gemmatimonas sp.]|nr:hypothetical protein [Gemmatimonas sp.]
MEALRIGVGICGLGAVVALAVQAARASAFGIRPLHAPAAGSATRGVLYAFGPGMSPLAKESTRTHPWAYALGVAYHLGVFAAFGYLLLLLLGVDVAPTAALGVPLLAGALGGLGLFVRRYASAPLRGLSVPDDAIANLLTTGFVALAAARLRSPAAEPALLAAAMLLLCYVPLGKIRHCVFFFLSRRHLGRHFGRRGTFPVRH